MCSNTLRQDLLTNFSEPENKPVLMLNIIIYIYYYGLQTGSALQDRDFSQENSSLLNDGELVPSMGGDWQPVLSLFCVTTEEESEVGLAILFINTTEAMLINQPALMPRSPHFLVTTYSTNKNAMLLRIRALGEEPPAAQGMRPWMVPYLYNICVKERIRRKQPIQLKQTKCNIFCNNNSLFSFDFLVFNTKERSDSAERRGTESLDHRVRVK